MKRPLYVIFLSIKTRRELTANGFENAIVSVYIPCKDPAPPGLILGLRSSFRVDGASDDKFAYMVVNI